MYNFSHLIHYSNIKSEDICVKHTGRVRKANGSYEVMTLIIVRENSFWVVASFGKDGFCNNSYPCYEFTEAVDFYKEKRINYKSNVILFEDDK